MVCVLVASRIKTQAARVGFSMCGLAHAERLPERPLFDWLAAGHAGELRYMKERTAERLDPRVYHPGTETVIVVAACYARSDVPPADVIARYAAGRDYHGALRKRLIRLCRYIEADFPEVRAKPCVDTGAVMERAWAVRAGLGWIGKNGCLLTREHGSWVLLGVLLVDLPADVYDTPVDDGCGECRRCLDGCPTGAIVSPGTVDCRRCLSYLTIEQRGPIPPEHGAHAEQAFGCDTCQDVCPWNVPGHACDDPSFAPREIASLEPLELAALDAERFVALTRGTAVARPGHAGLRRNALTVLGARRDERARPIAEALATHEDPGLAAAARECLRRLGKPS